MNYLLFTDMHIHNHKGQNRRLNDGLECLDWVLTTARNNKCKSVIFAGDLFHDKFKILVIAYQKVFEILKKFSDLNIYILVGNHDMWFYDNWDISSVKPFGALENVTIIDKPSTINIEGVDVDFVPYTHDPVAILAGFKNKSKILIGHLAVDGALLHFVYNTKADVEIESDSEMIKVSHDYFNGWERVFLGHYHGAQIINGRIEYIGSPMELTRAETRQEKHVILLNPETLEKRYIVNDFSPRHLNLGVGELKDYDLNNVFLQVQVDGIDTTDVLDLKRELLAKYNILDIEFTEKPKVQEVVAMQESQETFELVDGDLLEKFIKSNGVENLEEDLLLEIGRSIAGSEF